MTAYEIEKGASLGDAVMDDIRAEALEVRSLANEKLLKALIALLAVREESLLDELGAVFAMAEMERNEVGEGPKAVWLELRREMQLLRDLVRAGDAGGLDSASPRGSA